MIIDCRINSCANSGISQNLPQIRIYRSYIPWGSWGKASPSELLPSLGRAFSIVWGFDARHATSATMAEWSSTAKAVRTFRRWKLKPTKIGWCDRMPRFGQRFYCHLICGNYNWLGYALWEGLRSENLQWSQQADRIQCDTDWKDAASKRAWKRRNPKLCTILHMFTEDH